MFFSKADNCLLLTLVILTGCRGQFIKCNASVTRTVSGHTGSTLQHDPEGASQAVLLNQVKTNVFHLRIGRSAPSVFREWKAYFDK